MEKANNENCVLATDFSEVDKEMDLWMEMRNKKANIYHAFSEYIFCLERSLKDENDSYKRIEIERELEKLKKEQKKYYVPSMLELAVCDGRKDKKSKDTLEKSSFSLIKRLRKK